MTQKIEERSGKKPERLLSRYQAAVRLGIKPSAFSGIKAGLIAKGLQEVRIGKSKRYREASIDRMIVTAAEKGMDL